MEPVGICNFGLALVFVVVVIGVVIVVIVIVVTVVNGGNSSNNNKPTGTLKSPACFFQAVAGMSLSLKVQSVQPAKRKDQVFRRGVSAAFLSLLQIIVAKETSSKAAWREEQQCQLRQKQQGRQIPRR